MKNEFTANTRFLFFDTWECFWCGCNGEGRGGLELHHIQGRVSDSPLNAAPVCHYCHEHMCHNDKEERYLLGKTIRFLLRIKYTFTADDLAFYNRNKKTYDQIA